MRVIKLSFVLQAQKDCYLPAFKGAMLRGALGYALLELAKSEKPEINSLVAVVIDDLFKGDRVSGDERFKSSQTKPHPFQFWCSNFSEKISKDDLLDFELTLFGKAIEHLPVLIQAFAVACARGLGGERAIFRLNKVINISSARFETLYENGRFVSHAKPEECYLKLEAPEKNRCSQTLHDVEIALLSPTRWVNSVNKNTVFVYRDFLKAILRRCSTLCYFWGNDEWQDFDFAGALSLAESVKVVGSNISWASFARFSTTQNKDVPLMGWEGTVKISNLPESQLQILKTGSLAHIGKGAVFGLGRFEIDMI